MPLTESDKKQFRDLGILKLKGFLDKAALAPVHNKVMSELERLQLKVRGKLSTAKIQDLPLFQQTTHLGQIVKVGPEIGRLFTEELESCMNQLAGAKLRALHSQPQILLSFPHKEEWSLKRMNWHLDLKPEKKDHISGVQAFVLIDDVQPKGGGTLAIAGSHKLHYIKAGHSAHSILSQEAAFMSTPEIFLKPQVIQGIHIHIVEMAGKAGDIFLMDLRVLHSPSINTSKNIRMMATNRFAKEN